MPTLAFEPHLPSNQTLFAGLLNPPVLFFFLGAFAAIVKSNLRVPSAVTKLLSLYLLWSIGFQGGVKLVHAGVDFSALKALGAGILLACVVPIYAFWLLRRLVTIENAAAIAAAYGSISAVTFMTAQTVLEARGIATGGHMVASMALMESPAIVIGVMLLRLSQPKSSDVVELPAVAAPAKRVHRSSWGSLLHEAFLNGPVLLMLGSMVIGMLTGDKGFDLFRPLCKDLFSGVLVFFLLDLGILAARRIKDLRKAGWKLITFGLVAPPVNATVALLLAKALNLSVGDGILLMVLGGSASYIAVPAAIRFAIPKANPGLYIPLPLAVTFPFNIAIGLPIYIEAAAMVLR
jgi:hypothetical protein